MPKRRAEKLGALTAKLTRSASSKPLPNYGEKKLRFKLEHSDPHEPQRKGTLYIGAHFCFAREIMGKLGIASLPT